MLQTISFAGLEFSPLVILLPIAFLLVACTRFILHWLHLREQIWKVAWFEVALFFCYLAATVYLLGGR